MANKTEDQKQTEILIGKVTSHWASANGIVSHYKKETKSTNDWAKEEAFLPETLEQQVVLYTCEHQTAGRGRGKNNWQDGVMGSCLLSSWSFMYDGNPQPVLSPQMGLALYRASLATWPQLNWSLKAPNDLYLGDKKVAGLLLENVIQGDDLRLIVGLGFNVFSDPAPESICISEALSKNSPLLGDDWIGFLDRLFLEFSIVIGGSQAKLSSTDCAILVSALNRFPKLTGKIDHVDDNGDMTINGKKISWMSL